MVVLLLSSSVILTTLFPPKRGDDILEFVVDVIIEEEVEVDEVDDCKMTSASTSKSERETLSTWR